VLIQEYDARLPIFHFDAYRLANEDAFEDLGVHEYFEGSGVCLVEWADRVPRCLPRAHLEIRLTITGTESRRLELTAHSGRYEELLQRL
jgi:tRNA threonylcarbamoyladenosine biosynthesis protein TsaE